MFWIQRLLAIKNWNNRNTETIIIESNPIIYHLEDSFKLFWVTLSSILFYLFCHHSLLKRTAFVLETLPGYYPNADIGRDIRRLSIDASTFNQSFRNESDTFQTDLLHHGLHGTGSVWLLTNQGQLDSNGDYIEYDEKGNIKNNTEQINDSLGFALSARGYDVWLANSRGNIYSSKHRHYDYNSEEYWRFSLDDMIYFDLPAMIDHLRATTNHSTIAYVGHSQGNILMLGLMSINDYYQQMIQPFIALSPCWHLINVQSLATKIKFIPHWFKEKPSYHLMNNLEWIRESIAKFCSNRYFVETICSKIFYGFVGDHRDNLRLDRLAVYLYNVPTGAAAWNTLQLADSLNGPIKHFNYGEKYNFEIYGQSEPPIYNVSRINSTNIAFFYARNDSINSLEANHRLKNDLTVPLFDDYMIEDPDWNHMSFIFAKNVGKIVNQRLEKILEIYSV
ncbi:Gastric triacylglycerol lipase [Sarcoptes scabiei]|uniref:Gastric triacylglycerol lipase n=1 Tax=Sarcoptes scabiei TaxID=52283 RepID=A0A834VDT3_SARSC|nr:Gastric triacylglycerol lipase [Sarcoptes scabiei]